MLSQATGDEVNSLWAGLGYYRRAQSLLKGAQLVMNVQRDSQESSNDQKSNNQGNDEGTDVGDRKSSTTTKSKKRKKEVSVSYDSTFPSTLPGLLSLPGVGPYTAGAISSIAYGNKDPIVDGNIIRVLARVRALHKNDGYILNAGNKKIDTVCWTLTGSLVRTVAVPQSFNQGKSFSLLLLSDLLYL